MSKRITSIELSNFRAYYGNYDLLELSSGQNLLIYGENGSGKSSLYKALNNYFQSSINSGIPYIKNRYQTADDGRIELTFSDFDATTGEISAGSEMSYAFGSLASNNTVPFIQNAARVKGFLDYTDLLKVYLHSEARPNLFDLIVMILLGNHIPVASGGNFEFARKWKQLKTDLTTGAFNRNSRAHKAAIRQLPEFEVHLRHTLNLIFIELNRLLTTYFADLSLQLSYDLQPIVFNYGWKWEWHTTADLRLNVIKDGIVITGDYSDYLNEARLSAIAICLYLSSLLQNPTAIDLRILYLDDVFIGLDAGNRLPILSILQNEFRSYQIFISTYDRHWFELAKRHFEIYTMTKWSNIEIYVGQDTAGAISISKPILVKGQSNYEKAIQYVHNRTKPDYAAAANYFRKALEELIPKYIPSYELANEEKTQLADFKLTSLIYRAKAFIEKTANDPVEINKIIGLLHVLLHPLSHHEISSPVYKAELLILETTFVKFEKQLKVIDAANNFQCVCEITDKLKLSFTIETVSNHNVYYDLVLKEPLIIQHNPAGTPMLLDSKCYAERAHGTKDGNTLKEYKPKKNDVKFNYVSLEDAVDKIHAYLVSETGIAFTKPTNYIDVIERYIVDSWSPLSGHLIWK